jgi:hypothetical protein
VSNVRTNISLLSLPIPEAVSAHRNHHLSTFHLLHKSTIRRILVCRMTSLQANIQSRRYCSFLRGAWTDLSPQEQYLVQLPHVQFLELGEDQECEQNHHYHPKILPLVLNIDCKQKKTTLSSSKIGAPLGTKFSARAGKTGVWPIQSQVSYAALA